MAGKVALIDMILWAKDRAMDDLLAFLDDEGHEEYMGLDKEERDRVRRMCQVLSMPDDDPETLAALSIHYWNGEKDTFFETHDLPEKGFVGFCGGGRMRRCAHEETDKGHGDPERCPKETG